jgi:hypothetical protein
VLSLRVKDKDLYYKLYKDDHHVGGGLCGYMAGLVFNKVMFGVDPLKTRWIPNNIDDDKTPPGGLNAETIMIYRQAAADAFRPIKKPNFPDNPLFKRIYVELIEAEIGRMKIGAPIKKDYDYLKQLAKNKNAKGKEAMLVLKSIDKWIKQSISETNALETNSPSSAYINYTELYKTINGFRDAGLVRSRLRKLNKDKYLLQLVAIRRSYNELTELEKLNNKNKTILLKSLDELSSNSGLSWILKADIKRLKKDLS